MINLFNVDDDSNFKYMLESVGRSITVNDSPTEMKAIITNTSLNTNYDDRKISLLERLNRGDMIEYNGNRYMVISEVNDKRYSHYKGIMRHLPHEIIFNHRCMFETAHVYIENGNPSLIGGNVLTLIQDKITVNVPARSTSLQLTTGDTFMIQGNKFKIITNDTYSQPGISILTCERDQINPATDDVEHNIANGLACPINVTNQEPITVNVSETLQLNWTSPHDAPVEFVSSNNTIATVDAQGLVTGIAEGDVTITVTNVSNGYIFDTVRVSVVDVPDTKTINIVYDAPEQQNGDHYFIYYTETGIFTANVLPLDEPVSFELYADNKTSAVDTSKFTKVVSGNSIKITAKSSAYYLQIKAILDSDPSVYTWQRVRIRGFV
ncbi:Bacterial Ig-like domain (group 2) [compost metagenome]